MRRGQPQFKEGADLQAHLTEGQQRPNWELVNILNGMVEYGRMVEADPTHPRSVHAPLAMPSDPFRDEVVRCLASEVACDCWLDPLYWTTAVPHVEVVTHVTRDNVIVVAVRPWRDFVDQKSGLKVDGRSDFGQLREGSRPAPVEVMRFDLRSLGHPAAQDDSDEAQKVLTLQRSVVFKLYERAVSTLSRRFNCRVNSGLVCFGPANDLTVREVSAGDAVEIANLISDDSSTWHPTLPKLCQRMGIRADETLGLYRGRLSSLKIEQQARSLLEFSGRKSTHGIPLDLPLQLARALGAVCNTEGRLPLSTSNQDAARAELERLAKHPRGLCSQLLDVYGLDEDDAWLVVSRVDPLMYRQMPRPARRWRREFEVVAAGEIAAWETPAEMTRRMIEQMTAEGAAASVRWDVQVRRVCESMGLDQAGLRKWGEQHAPEVAQWVVWMAETRAGKVKPKRA